MRASEPAPDVVGGQRPLPLQSPLPSAFADLARLRAEGGRGLYGSAGELFSDAIFGRDSVQTAEDILEIRPDIAREVILTLGSLQGVREAPPGPGSDEEEQGKIPHEHRRLHIGGRRISPGSERILAALAAVWGGTPEELTYYGSVDATPLYVRLAARYCECVDLGLLQVQVRRRDGAAATVLDCVRDAVDWVVRRLRASDLGFLEFRRRNPDGIPFQVWKDSGTSYVHLDGRIANHESPIAAVEVQGYAYDALLGAAALLPERADELRELADGLRTRLLEQIWMPGPEYFAMGLDRDATGRPRWIESIASNAGLLLDTRVFEGLPDAGRYIDPVIRRLAGSEFMTEAGVRCRSVAECDLVDFADYHGSWAVWGRETFNVLKGMRRQGRLREARALGAALLSGVNAAGAHVEFLYVSPDGRVMYDYQGLELGPEVVYVTNVPEAPQAWTVTAALATKRWFGTEPRPGAGLLHDREQVEAVYGRRGRFRLDRSEGVERDQAARRRGWGRPVRERSTPSPPAPLGAAASEGRQGSSR